MVDAMAARGRDLGSLAVGTLEALPESSGNAVRAEDGAAGGFQDSCSDDCSHPKCCTGCRRDAAASTQGLASLVRVTCWSAGVCSS